MSQILRMKREVMVDMTVRQQMAILRREAATWKSAAIGLLSLSVLTSTALCGLYAAQRQKWEAESDYLRQELRQSESIRDFAVQELGALSAQTAMEQKARKEQAEAYEAVGDYIYMGVFQTTAYCPCSECCGRWADGLTATGLPAGPGIVAVDPAVIPLGSAVIIDGQRYLAADTGVTGYHVDICAADHQEAETFGVRTEEVWVKAP